MTHDSFVVAGAQFAQLVVHTNDTLDVVQRLDIGPASPPIVTRGGHLIVGTESGVLRSYRRVGRTLVEANSVAPEHSSAWAHPFELGNGTVAARREDRGF